MSIKSLVRSKLSRFLEKWDHTIVPVHETWQHQWEAVIQEYAPDLVFDVGANVGQWYESFRAVNKQATVYSFEPDPRAFELLSKRHAELKDSKWKIFEIALGSTGGQAEMNLWDVAGGSSSIKDLTPDGEAFTGQDQSSFNQVKVDLTTLDAFIDSIGLHGGKVMLKLDVQGYEIEVLSGSLNSLTKNIGVVEVEIPFRTIYASDSSVSTIDSILTARHFMPVTFQTKRWNMDLNAAADFDAIYVRT